MPHEVPNPPAKLANAERRTEVLYSITKHAMRRSADEIGATSISFRPKAFSDDFETSYAIRVASKKCLLTNWSSKHCIMMCQPQQGATHDIEEITVSCELLMRARGNCQC